MVRCKEASASVASSQPPRSLARRLAVRFHLAICPECRAFRRQIAAMAHLARESAARIDAEVPRDFETALVERLTVGKDRRS